MLAGYMDDYYIVGDMMMMSSYLYDDRLFHMMIDADILNWWYLVLADLDGYVVSHIWIECEWFCWYRHTLMIHALTQDAGLVADDRCYGADHTILLLMFIMILFRCLVFVINVMYIIRCKGHIKTHDVIMCLYSL